MVCFAINDKTGLVTLAKDIAQYAERKVYQLSVSVVNRAVVGKGGDVVGPKSYTTLNIGVGRQSSADSGFHESPGSDNSHQAHIRRRRVGTAL